MFGIGLAVHALAVLTAAVIHNLKQTRRTCRRKNRNPTTDGPPPSDTTPPVVSTPPLNHPRPGVMVGVPRVCLLRSRNLSPPLTG